MHEWVQALIAVQDKDLRIARLQSQVVAVPHEKEKAQAALREAEQAVAAAKVGLQDVEKSIKGLEIEVESINAKRRDFESKTVMIKNNDEYKAALHQIDGCKQQIGGIEERELVLMEQLETARGRVEAEKRRLEGVAKRTQQLLEDLDSRQRNCQLQVDKLTEQRNELLKGVDTEAVRIYQRILTSRLRSNSKEPVAFAPVQENNGSYNCSCCHMNIPAHVRMEALKGQRVTCPNCSVLLYLERA